MLGPKAVKEFRALLVLLVAPVILALLVPLALLGLLADLGQWAQKEIRALRGQPDRKV